MSGPPMDGAVAGVTVLGSLMLARSARVSALRSRRARLLGGRRPSSLRGGATELHRPISRSSLLQELRGATLLARLAPVAGGAAGWLVGNWLAPPVGGLAGLVALALVPRALRRRRVDRTAEVVERQLAETAEAVAQAVRSGMSVQQGFELAWEEAVAPMRGLLDGVVAKLRLGVRLDVALSELKDVLGTDDGRLFALVLDVHARSGGDVGGALHEVARTIRRRVALRRELRALTAQGRISGAVLGSLPVAFFVVLTATSRGSLEPVLRSSAGIAMVGAGLLMQGAAYVWIRRLLRVEA